MIEVYIEALGTVNPVDYAGCGANERLLQLKRKTCMWHENPGMHHCRARWKLRW